MLVNIQTFLLDDTVATQTVNLVENFEDDEANDEAEHEYGTSAKSLYAEVSLNTIDSRICKDTNSQSSEDTANTMNGYGTDRVIDLEHLVDKAY